MRILGFILLLLTVGLAGCWCISSPLSKTAVFQPKLDNTQARFFEMPTDLGGAIAKFDAMGAKLHSVEEADHCIFHPFGAPKRVVILADNSWRQGTVCIVPVGNRVAEVYWLFQPGAP
jgi:hypothetical protein